MIEMTMTVTAKNHILKHNSGSAEGVFSFKYVSLGKGGITATKVAKEPTGQENGLYDTVRRFDFNEVLMQKEETEPDKFFYRLRLPASKLLGIDEFSELGIEDENNNLLFIGCFESIKVPAERHIILEIENSFQR